MFGGSVLPAQYCPCGYVVDMSKPVQYIPATHTMLMTVRDELQIMLTAVTDKPQERERVCLCFPLLLDEGLSLADRTWSKMPTIAQQISQSVSKPGSVLY